MRMSTNKILFAGIEWMMQVVPARKSICKVPIRGLLGLSPQAGEEPGTTAPSGVLGGPIRRSA